MGAVREVEQCVVEMSASDYEGPAPENGTTYRCVGQLGCNGVEFTAGKGKVKKYGSCPNVGGIGD